VRRRIPFNKPFIVGNEMENISDAVDNYCQLAGNGEYTKRCEQWLENHLSCKRVLLTHSCTASLEMAAILLGIQAGDEVIMPSFTFVSTASAFVLRGGVPVFVDIRPDSLNLDETKIEAAITDRTKAVVPVHYAGVPCQMDMIMDIAGRHDLPVVEDAAQGMLSTWRGAYLGTIGDLGAISFHETKNVISGEGGALLINNESLRERAEIIWEKGTNRRQFFEGRVDKYTWVDVGSSYAPSDMIAAFLYAQLEHSVEIIEKRKSLAMRYCTGLRELEDKGLVRLGLSDNAPDSNGHIFFIVARSEEERAGLIDHLNSEGISALFHYVPLHSSPAGKKYGRVHGSMEVTEHMSSRILRLPMFFEMCEEDVGCVVGSIKRFFSGPIPE
jgi:dTDP-4-amino-4,6-dideoxygalactose transaminase